MSTYGNINHEKLVEHNDISQPAIRLSQHPGVKEYAITILENISDAIILLDQTGKIKDVNRTVLKLFNVSKNELLNIFIDEILIDTPDHLKSSRSPGILEALHRGQYHDVEAILKYRKNMLPVYASFSVINNFDGSVNSIIVSAKDISHIKYLEKKLIAQQILTISQDRIRSLGEMLVGLVHELGQPLSSMKLVADMILKNINQPDIDKQQLGQRFDDMLNFITRMSGTIHSIRSFAQRTQDNACSLVDLKQSMTEALSLMRYDFDRNNIKVDLQIDSNLPKLWLNPVSLDQVFVNLLTNSKDAYDVLKQKTGYDQKLEEIIRVSITCEKSDWVIIRIADNAGGIDSAVRSKIFEPFFTTKKPGKGTGLGLPIAQEIIGLMGGDLNCNVVEGQGTEFIVRLPIDEENAPRSKN